MSAEECARQIYEAMNSRERDVIIADSFRTKIAPFLKLLVPNIVDNIARKGMEAGES